jgi:hypothetical protein
MSVVAAGFAITAGRRLDMVSVLQLRAWARAYLWSIGEYDLHEAVDILQQAAAERYGLIAWLGQDAAQALIAREFQPFRKVLQ